jgi:hypothetical protein
VHPTISSIALAVNPARMSRNVAGGLTPGVCRDQDAKGVGMPVAKARAMTISKHPRRPALARIFSPLLVLLAVPCLGRPAMAQANISTESPISTVKNLPSAYVTAGLGFASGIGPALLAEATVAGEHVQVTGRFSKASEFTIGTPGTQAAEFGVMAGYGQKFGLARFYAMAGFGFVSIERRGREIPYNGDGWHSVEYERLSETVPCVPLQVGVDLGRHIVGGDLALTANLNSSQAYVGLLLTVNLGKLRSGP